MAVFNPNSVCLGSCIFLVGSQGYVFFNGPRVCPRLMVVFNPNSVCLGSCILSSRIIMVSNFIGPRMCPRLLVALTQTPLFGQFVLSYWIMKISCSAAGC